MKKVLIEIEGGAINIVAMSKDIEVVIIDYDIPIPTDRIWKETRSDVDNRIIIKDADEYSEDGFTPEDIQSASDL